MTTSIRCCLAASLLIVASCARSTSTANPGGSNSIADGSRALIGKNANVIRQDELTDPVVMGMDLLRAIRKLRPAFFRVTGPQSFYNSGAGQTLMSQDYGPVQPIVRLTDYSTMDILEIRYLNASEATTRFGVNANGGPVIVLLSVKQP